jgi:hypothetical protein
MAHQVIVLSVLLIIKMMGQENALIGEICVHLGILILEDKKVEIVLVVLVLIKKLLLKLVYLEMILVHWGTNQTDIATIVNYAQLVIKMMVKVDVS